MICIFYLGRHIVSHLDIPVLLAFQNMGIILYIVALLVMEIILLALEVLLVYVIIDIQGHNCRDV